MSDNMIKLIASIVLSDPVAGFIELLESRIDPFFASKQIFFREDFIRYVIECIQNYPGGMNVVHMLPEPWQQNPNIAAYILLILHMYGYTRYRIEKTSNVWMLSDPKRISTDEFAKVLIMICQTDFRGKFSATETNEYMTSTLANGILILKPQTSVLYGIKLLTEMLETHGCFNGVFNRCRIDMHLRSAGNLVDTIEIHQLADWLS